MKFGRRGEKFDPDQLKVAREDREQAVAEREAKGKKADPPLRARPRAAAEPRPSLHRKTIIIIRPL